MAIEINDKEVSYVLAAEQDDIPVRGNAMVSGDPATDKEAEDEILARLDRGDVWAWADVAVTAMWRGFKGVARLGGCSYRNEAEFREDAYFEDMKRDALRDLECVVNDIDSRIHGR